MAVGVKVIAAFLALSLERFGFAVSGVVAREAASPDVGVVFCASFSGMLAFCSSIFGDGVF